MQSHRLAKMAVINEEACIGCTKCIDACPIDAIIGSTQQMHTIITQECVGCGLCISPCPVDCIDLIEIPQSLYQIEKIRERHRARKKRLQQKKFSTTTIQSSPLLLEEKKKMIQAALERVKNKRHE